MTNSCPSLKANAYYLYCLLLLIVGVTVCTPAAYAQLGPPPVANGGPNDYEDPNPKTPYDTRTDYHLRFPFAENAFRHDEKEVYDWETREVEGPPSESFFSNAAGAVDDFVGSLGFGPIFGSSSNSSSSGNGEPILRSQYSEPLNGAAGPETVEAYPLYIKFCNDNPYQGICYWQFGIATDEPRTERDMELFENVLTTFGYPVSDTQFQLIQRENFQRLLELLYDPERFVWMGTNTSQMQAASAANSLAGVSEYAFERMVEYILDGHNDNGGLLNVANERSATPMAMNELYRPVSAAYDVVMRCYKELFVPMAILFLLPGAVISQAKATVSKGFDLGGGSPFEGIIRSMVAVFLIPGTQVIVSYSIDVGNSMATTAEDYVDRGLILEWQHELTYNVNPVEGHANVIKPPDEDIDRQTGLVVFEGQNGAGSENVAGGGSSSGGGGGGGLLGLFQSFLGWLAGVFDAGVFGSGGEGLGANVPEGNTTQEEQLALSQAMQFIFNGASFLGALTIIILTALQVVLICYLFLMGPLSAALFAWPEIGGSAKLFRNVFGNWLQAVIIVSLWRFFWVVGLVIMTQRLLYINHPNGAYLGTGDLQWEVAIFVCLLSLMIWSSMNPFSYSPSEAFAAVEKFAETSGDVGKSMDQSSGGGGGQGASGGDGGQGGQGQTGDSDDGTSSGGGGDSSDNRPNSPDVESSDSSTVAVADSNQGDATIDTSEGQKEGAESSSQSNSQSESMANQSPETSAPPTESPSGGGADSSTGGGADTPPPSAGADNSSMNSMVGMVSQTSSGGSDPQVASTLNQAGVDNQQNMPESNAPVSTTPGDGSSTTGVVSPNANAQDAQASVAGQTQSSSGTDGPPSDGSSGSTNLNLAVEGGQDSGDSSSGQSSSPPPDLGGINPPPMSDSDDE